MLSFEKFSALLEKVKANQANYQPVTLCFLSTMPNLEATQIEIAERLAIKNGLKKGDFKQFMASCPVWKVLTGKKMIVKDGNYYRLNTTLTPTQKDKVMEICKGLMK